jgi:hypothetical protein
LRPTRSSYTRFSGSPTSPSDQRGRVREGSEGEQPLAARHGRGHS